MQTLAMNIPSSSSGHPPHESVDWTSSDPPKLPRHWAYLLPLSMTQDVAFWGCSLLALLVKELVIRHSAMGNPNGGDVVRLARQVSTASVVARAVQGLACVQRRPDKTAANTWLRNFFAFVFEEYGFGGARAWARHLFEAKIENVCKRWMTKEGK